MGRSPVGMISPRSTGAHAPVKTAAVNRTEAATETAAVTTIRSPNGVVGALERKAIVDDFLQLFAYLEEGETFSWNLYRFAGARIAARVGFIRSNREAPEATDLDSVTTLEGLDHAIEHAVDDEFSAGLG